MMFARKKFEINKRMLKRRWLDIHNIPEYFVISTIYVARFFLVIRPVISRTWLKTTARFSHDITDVVNSLNDPKLKLDRTILPCWTCPVSKWNVLNALESLVDHVYLWIVESVHTFLFLIRFTSNILSNSIFLRVSARPEQCAQHSERFPRSIERFTLFLCVVSPWVRPHLSIAGAVLASGLMFFGNHRLVDPPRGRESVEEQRPGPVCDQPRYPLRTNNPKHEQRCLPPLTSVKVHQPFHHPFHRGYFNFLIDLLFFATLLKFQFLSEQNFFFLIFLGGSFLIFGNI